MERRRRSIAMKQQPEHPPPLEARRQRKTAATATNQQGALPAPRCPALDIAAARSDWRAGPRGRHDRLQRARANSSTPTRTVLGSGDGVQRPSPLARDIDGPLHFLAFLVAGPAPAPPPPPSISSREATSVPSFLARATASSASSLSSSALLVSAVNSSCAYYDNGGK